MHVFHLLSDNSVLVEMAEGSIETLDKKITANIKPACNVCS